MQIKQNNEWAMEEFAEIDLGDKRLNERLVTLCDSLSESPESPINQACADWAETKAAYRFFKNENVAAEKIMATHAAKTAQRVSKHRVVLAIQDTSYIIYTAHKATTGLGQLSVKNGRRIEKIYSMGLLMHSCLAVTTEGLPLGLLDQTIVARESVAEDDRTNKDRIPIEEKESYRWLESLNNSKQLCGNTQIVTVCDREADIYEFFKFSNDLAAPVLVRANYDRAVNKRCMYQEGDVCKLWELLEKQPCAGEFVVEVPHRRATRHILGRVSRIATVELRYGSFKLNPSKHLSSKLPDLNMQAVYVIEKDPPPDVEQLEWMLLTNLTIGNFEEAYEKVLWYCLRWRIEMFHKVLKSGFRVEHCRLATAQRLIRYLTVMSIVACRLFMITLIARTDPDTPCSDLMADTEWKILFLKIHKTKQPNHYFPSFTHHLLNPLQPNQSSKL